MYTLDTNPIIYYVKGDATVVPELESLFRESFLYIATVTELELFCYPSLSQGEEARITDFLKSVAIVQLDSQIARRAARIRQVYRLKVADSIIAATALFTGSTLVTRNVRDFKRIPSLSLHPI